MITASRDRSTFLRHRMEGKLNMYLLRRYMNKRTSIINVIYCTRICFKNKDRIIFVVSFFYWLVRNTRQCTANIELLFSAI